MLYNTGIFIYTALIHLVAPFNSKASLWVKGRKGWQARLADKINRDDRKIWIHCSSLGEFEQGRPIIEEIRKEHPEFKIILTFFSPSGFEIRKNYSEAECVEYLPADFPGNARKFIRLVKPEFVIFVKYEFWNNYISELYKNEIPLYLVSGIFRPGQHFFSWYGSFFRKILGRFEKIFVQDQQSFDLLRGIGLENTILAGDTRFDRVLRITGTARDIPQVEQFRGGERLFLAGSSWKKDEEIITQYINRYPAGMKWVFAPHEIDKSNIDRIEKLLDVKVVRFSAFTPEAADARVLIIDNIGMLSSAYKYAYIAAIGGGFGRGIHNILEPACWKIPVIFGPNFENFREAVELTAEKGAISFDSYESFSGIMEKLTSDEVFYMSAAETAGKYIARNIGATEIILKQIFR
ncbi:MAG: 3-deoxy-D-manno-octulosonic acid transferase [Bacteroidales bacterium]|nr:3-deoxy-D-manno-octulosonic acid transferase [Bacteroidales bacterium]